MKSRFAIGMFTVVVLGLGVSARADFTMDDITYWVGEGTNSAALVVDWNDGKTPESLAWGYRWNGSVTAYDMMAAIAGDGFVRESYGGAITGAISGDDPRLFFRVSDWGWGLSAYGWGYDADNDGGGFICGYEDSTGAAENGAAVDADDHYEEGWFTSFWSNWISPDGAAWTFPSLGMTDLSLADGDWCGFSHDAEFSFSDPPSEPVAATVPEPATMVLCVVGGVAMLLRRRRRR